MGCLHNETASYSLSTHWRQQQQYPAAQRPRPFCCLWPVMADRKCTHAHWRQRVKTEYQTLPCPGFDWQWRQVYVPRNRGSERPARSTNGIGIATLSPATPIVHVYCCVSAKAWSGTAGTVERVDCAGFWGVVLNPTISQICWRTI